MGEVSMAEWAAAAERAIRRFRPLAGDNVTIEDTPEGQRINVRVDAAAEAAVGGSAIQWAKVGNNNTGAGLEYWGGVHTHIEALPAARDVKIRLPNHLWCGDDVLPAGTILPCVRQSYTTGEGEEAVTELIWTAIALPPMVFVAEFMDGFDGHHGIIRLGVDGPHIYIGAISVAPQMLAVGQKIPEGTLESVARRYADGVWSDWQATSLSRIY
jgi:hypothetical protein